MFRLQPRFQTIRTEYKKKVVIHLSVLAGLNGNVQGARVHRFPPQLSGTFWPEPVVRTCAFHSRTDLSDRPDRINRKRPKKNQCSVLSSLKVCFVHVGRADTGFVLFVVALLIIELFLGLFFAIRPHLSIFLLSIWGIGTRV